jgi:hypothetical protein
MVTKEQALTGIYFIEHTQYVQMTTGNRTFTWRANGKCKTWKTRLNEFKLPIKHGLYSYGYITQDNCHLFEVKE